MPLGTRLRTWGARVVRNQRTVLQTYPGLRLGNVLYFALHAHVQQAGGADYQVLDPAPQERWASALPGLAPLLLHPDDLRATDGRVHIPASFLQGFGSDFTADELTQFARERLTEPLLNVDPLDDGTAVVNVRRGDYYTDNTFRSLFGYDVPDYLHRALEELVRTTGPVTQVLVVSDDPAWCRTHLGFLADGSRTVAFSSVTDSPLDNLRSIARSRRLVLTNSTFSYWGAYLSGVQHQRTPDVWAPDLHSRGVDGGRPWQHDPTWRTLPVRQP